MIDNLEVGLVKASAQVGLSRRQTHSICNALAQRSCTNSRSTGAIRGR